MAHQHRAEPRACRGSGPGRWRSGALPWPGRSPEPGKTNTTFHEGRGGRGGEGRGGEGRGGEGLEGREGRGREPLPSLAPMNFSPSKAVWPQRRGGWRGG